MGRILIAGCGDVGTILGLRLVADGHQVWGLRREPRVLPAPIQPLAADLSRPESLGGLPARLDAVVFTAAAPERTDDAYRATYVDGTANLLGALATCGQAPARWLFASSTGVYHQDDGSRVDETSATEPASFTGRRMLEAERVLQQAPGTSVAVRFGGIYGPGRTRLIARAASGESLGDAAARCTNRIHTDDCAGALRHLLALPSPAAVYVAVDDQPAPLADVVEFIRAHQGLPPLPAAAATAPSGKRCSNQRLRSSGFTLRYPSYRQGYAALLDA